MCGFVGFTNKINDANKIIKECADKIAHRGPDSDGYFIDENVAMGFRRLSIIDITESGDQPIFNEDKTKVLMFNGEIYNYMPLREELIAKGHIFSTHTDSEVLLHGYEEYGEDLLQKLRGMFAFIIYDKKSGEIFIARDFFGIKPLYYAKMGDTFIWCSEIKGMMPHPAFKKELNTAALESYLTFQYNPLSETFFKNVWKLTPGHFLRYKDGEITVKRYWQAEFNANEDLTLDQATEAISDIFKDSVKAHKIADVEVGSFLSSGVDSSYAAAVSSVDKTFTVGFGEAERYNEISWAKEFSAYIGKQNISKVITPEEYWDVIPKVQYHMDEPLADPSCIALYFVCNKAAEYVKVVLSGEGADEIFGGYNVYTEPSSLPAYNLLPKSIRRGIGKMAQRFDGKRGANFLIRRGKDLEERFIGNAFMFSDSERDELLSDSVSRTAPPFKDITKPFYDKVKDQDAVTKMQFIDLNLWLVGDILLKADKMSMANSLELRVPFLDIEVMKVAETIPTKHRVTKENTKYALRRAALKYAPPKTADKKKLGFPVPTRVWLRTDKYYNYMKEVFTTDNAAKFFKTDRLIKLLDRHKNGEADVSRKIWTVYAFLVWYGVYFGD
jgi:asparagine synthase (glutamine-hydrolysing)